MTNTLLTTKLFLPPLIPGLVPRPRLLARLEKILNTKLTLVSAQAGFGKTTLISQWLYGHKPPLPTAWLSLEEADFTVRPILAHRAVRTVRILRNTLLSNHV